MKIDNTLKPTTAPTTPRAKPQAASSNGTGAAADVRLSPLAGQLATSDAEPPVNAARVAEIRQAIAEGRFSIDTGLIADRLISTSRELVAGRLKA